MSGGPFELVDDVGALITSENEGEDEFEQMDERVLRLTLGCGVPSGVSVGVGTTEASDRRGGITFLAVGLGSDGVISFAVKFEFGLSNDLHSGIRQVDCQYKRGMDEGFWVNRIELNYSKV